MIPKTYTILERAVEEGALRGYRRAFKHVDNPSEDSIIQFVVHDVMNSISEVFDFPELERLGESYK